MSFPAGKPCSRDKKEARNPPLCSDVRLRHPPIQMLATSGASPAGTRQRERTHQRAHTMGTTPYRSTRARTLDRPFRRLRPGSHTRRPYSHSATAELGTAFRVSARASTDRPLSATARRALPVSNKQALRSRAGPGLPARLLISRAVFVESCVPLRSIPAPRLVSCCGCERAETEPNLIPYRQVQRTLRQQWRRHCYKHHCCQNVGRLGWC